MPSTALLVLPSLFMGLGLRAKVGLSLLLVVVAIISLYSLLPPQSYGVFGLVTGILVTAFAGLLYWWIDKPLNDVIARMDQSSSDAYLNRAPEEGAEEFGQLGQLYNKLLARITDLNAERIDQDRELVWAQERLQLQGDLDLKTKQLEKRLNERELLAELAETFTSTLDIDEVLETVCRRVSEALGIDEIAVLLSIEGADGLEVAASHGISAADEIQGLHFDIGEGVTGRVWVEEEMVYIPDVTQDPQFLHWKGHHKVVDGSCVAVLLAFAGEKLGVVDFTRLRRDAFAPPELEMLQIIAKQAAIAVRNARSYRRIHDMATHDELTGLLNRRTFMRRFESEWRRRIRFGDSVSVLVIDVDRFKSYNDTYGHLIGDRILAHVAKTLQSAVRTVDLVARYGGEEFVVLLPRTQGDIAEAVGEKLRLAIEGTQFEDSAFKSPTISVGVACATPDIEDIAPLDLLDAADQALLLAKEKGRNRSEVASVQSLKSGA